MAAEAEFTLLHELVANILKGGENSYLLNVVGDFYALDLRMLLKYLVQAIKGFVAATVSLFQRHAVAALGSHRDILPPTISQKPSYQITEF